MKRQTNKGGTSSKPVVKADQRQLLTVEDVAQRLQVSIHGVYKLIARRGIPYMKIGNRVRFDPGALEAWIKERAVMPMPEKPR